MSLRALAVLALVLALTALAAVWLGRPSAPAGEGKPDLGTILGGPAAVPAGGAVGGRVCAVRLPSQP